MKKQIGRLTFAMNIIDSSYSGKAIDLEKVKEAIKEVHDVIDELKDVAVFIYTPEKITERAKKKHGFISYDVACNVCKQIQSFSDMGVVTTWKYIDKMIDAELTKWYEDRDEY